MAFDLTWSVVANETGPRGIDSLNAASMVASDLGFPAAKRRARFFEESSRGMRVGGILKLVGRKVLCPTKFTVNDVAVLVGRKFERKHIALIRSGNGDRLAKIKGHERQKQCR